MLGGFLMSKTFLYEYTLNMEKIFQNKLLELNSYYCREDIELALNDVKKASKDSIEFRKKDLEQLCEARGIDAESLIKDNSLLDNIPTRAEIQDELLDAFYNIYSHAPKSKDFMERIVRRLAPEYKDDTVRTAILKKFLVGSGNKFKRFRVNNIMEWGKQRLSKSEQERFSSLSESEQHDCIISKIDDSIFTYEPVELSDVDTFLLIANRMVKYKEDKDLAFENLDLAAETLGLLDEMLKQYSQNVKGFSAYDMVLRMDELIKQGIVLKENLQGNMSELVVRLESDFKKQLKNIPRTSKTGKVTNAAELYKQAKKDAIKSAKTALKKTGLDYELIDMCNDLAKGNFRVNGKTKEYLYYFAFMFKMTVPLKGKEYKPEKDIVKNLFHDFYNDNLLRFLEGDYTEAKAATALENEPTGEGINYKNFVESIYLYFLCHDELDMLPGEKIDEAIAVIEECIKLAKKSEKQESKTTIEYTDVYRDHHFNVLLNKKRDEIAEYVVANYVVIPPDSKGIARIMISSEENTVSDLMDEIIEDLDAVYPDVFDNQLFALWQNHGNEKNIKNDILFHTDTAFDWKVKKLLEEKFGEDKCFNILLSKLEERVDVNKGRYNRAEKKRMIMLLHVLARFSQEKNSISTHIIRTRMEEKGIVVAGAQLVNALNVLIDIGYDIQKTGDSYYLGKREYENNAMDVLLKRVSDRYFVITDDLELMMTDILICRLGFDKRITRSELISMHFNYYIALLNETEGLYTFPDVFSDYADTINPFLEEARYQPLSEKNIFDMYIVMELYFYWWKTRDVSSL